MATSFSGGRSLSTWREPQDKMENINNVKCLTLNCTMKFVLNIIYFKAMINMLQGRESEQQRKKAYQMSPRHEWG
jgi:hypothetical protein